MIRFLLATIFGLIFGALWGIIFVDFTPQWYRSLPMWFEIFLLVLPIIAQFLFAMLYTSWDFKSCIVYSSIVIFISLCGLIYNEIINTGNLSHTPLFIVVRYCIVCGITLSLSWLLGKAFRRLIFYVLGIRGNKGTRNRGQRGC